MDESRASRAHGRPGQPAQGNAVARTGQRRRWPGRVHGGPAAAITLMLVVCACGPAAVRAGGSTARPAPGTVSPAQQAAGTVVPWTGHLAPPYPVTAPLQDSARPPLYRPCTAAELTGTLGESGLGAGSYTQYVALTDSGSRPCSLWGRPSRVLGRRTDGRWVTLPAAAAPSDLTGPANLLPRRAAQVALVTAAAICPSGAASCARTRYTAVALGIGRTGLVRVSLTRGQPFSVASGAMIGVSQFGVPPSPQPRTSSPLDVLTVSATLPHRLAARTTVTYTVTLHNPAGRPVPLRPCPSYAEWIQPTGPREQPPASNIHRYYLDCRPAPVVPAHGSVIFAMRIAVPAISGRARQGKWGWVLQGTTVEIGGLITIVRGR